MTLGYVVKRYPRFSETFIVNEILAHEDAGQEVAIFALRPSIDSHFQAAIGRVRAPVTYLDEALKASQIWPRLAALSGDQWRALEPVRDAPARDIAQAVHLAQEVAARGITHLHAHFATSAATVARVAAALAGIPFSLTCHAKDIFHESVDDENLANLFAAASQVITVSDYNVQDLTRRLGARDNLVRLYNGLDLERFPFQPALTANSNGPPAIVAVGRLVEKKGFGVLIDACELLASEGRNFTCQIIGTGDQEKLLANRIAAAGLQSVVHLTGALPDEQLRGALCNATCFAAPCIVGEDGNRDGLPTVLLESMALGTPCIATPVTGIPEAITDGDTGLLVPENDAVALAKALAKLLDDAELCDRIALAARRRIEADFDIHRNAAKLRQLLGVQTSESST